MNVKTLLKISRPRFWLYLGGTYLVGFVLGISALPEILSLQFFLHFAYFIFFANIFLYGVNDWYDRDTDEFNLKKGAKEHKLRKRDDKVLRPWLWLSSILGLVLMIVWFSPTTTIIWALWFFLSFFYSAPPLRFKARPIVDSLSNVLYAMPAFLAYVQSSGTLPAWKYIIAAALWTAAMHLFSAVPDIKADKKAGLLTTAILFGYKGALLLTSAYWLTTFILVSFGQTWWTLFFVVYPLIPLLCLLVPKVFDLERVYWFFPYLNALMGFVLFLGGALG